MTSQRLALPFTDWLNSLLAKILDAFPGSLSGEERVRIFSRNADFRVPVSLLVILGVAVLLAAVFLIILLKEEREGKRKGGAGSLLDRQTEGGTQIYVLCLFIMMFLLVLFRAMFDNQRLTITKDTVDDALTTSLVSSCLYNKQELGRSGSVVIYDTVTPAGGEIVVGVGGVGAIGTVPYDLFTEADLTNAYDANLSKSWDLFLKNLKKNLKLGDDMSATISGIDGIVTVTEYSIYNKFYNLDEDGAQTDFMFVRYRYTPSSGSWSVYSYTPNTYPSTYNSLTKSNYQIQESSVSANLSFTVVAGTATNFAQRFAGKTQTDYNVPVSYKRVVDIKLATP